MVRYQPQHKQETRRRLVDSAVTMLRRDGVANAGLKEIMQSLGMTVGGFYRHFPSKSALVQAAVAQGLSQSLERMQESATDDPAASIKRFAKQYLSQAHRESLADGCVLAALASDIARAEPEVKQACQAGLHEVRGRMLEQLPDDADVGEKLWGLIALEMGGLLLSRMVDDDATADEILGSCRQSVAALLRASDDGAAPQQQIARTATRGAAS